MDLRCVDVSETTSPELMMLSPVLAEAIAQSMVLHQGLPTLLLRSQRPFVLLGPKDRRLPRLDAGVDWLAGQGYRSYMRISGGSAVILDDTCLSFAVTRPCRDLTQWEKNFREMADGIITGLRILGIAAEFGEALGSYCQGPFDLVVSGQKVAGIAQAIRRGFALVNGMILISQDPGATTRQLQEFYARSGSFLRLRPEAVTSLQNVLNRPISHQEVRAALVQGFQQKGRLIMEPLTVAELSLAQSLLPLRLVSSDPSWQSEDVPHTLP